MSTISTISKDTTSREELFAFIEGKYLTDEGSVLLNSLVDVGDEPSLQNLHYVLIYMESVGANDVIGRVANMVSLIQRSHYLLLEVNSPKVKGFVEFKTVIQLVTIYSGWLQMAVRKARKSGQLGEVYQSMDMVANDLVKSCDLLEQGERSFIENLSYMFADGIC